ncbi:iron-sulfur cluster assembly scaffold protein [Hydrogenimonas cancrithermarum]|uniref:NIF system FeS cluster assembly NifU N-terminal domain-containing protein n=1 Tax=Hydrogenimonas cancrithermarum TaxID=2993563 RepID=A0ABN6WRR7_9BACT|nr:iron-sulfur cluster assembly scaffold protein [Hydrogenimonas cancrithermarum]BDY11845.1 hypothetical protein HCR_01570 [Hydrogenimonas cancrithermarum]
MDLKMKEVNDEILRHFANPRNYGEMKDADGVGTGVDNATKNYATIYLKIDNGTIEKATYVAHGSEDTLILGSVLTEMIEGDTLRNAMERVSALEGEVAEAYNQIEPPKIDLSKPEGEQVSPVSTESQDSANIVLTAFRAAVRHMERKKEGIIEEYFTMNIAKRCPYSNTDCAFVAKAP